MAWKNLIFCYHTSKVRLKQPNTLVFLTLIVWAFVLLGSESAVLAFQPFRPMPQTSQQPSDQHENRWLEPIIIVTGASAIISIPILIIYIFQLRAMRGSTDAARRSADAAIQSANVAERTLITTQRAWITVDAKIAAPLTFHELGATTTIAFKMRNVGNSPAIHVTPHVWLGIVKEGGPSPDEEQRRKCNEVRQGSFALGFTLFPGQSFPEAQGFGSAGWGVTITKEEMDRGRLITYDKKHVVLFIVGCVDYTFPSDSEHHHQTGFIYDILALSESGTPVGQVSLDGGNIPVEKLGLVESFLGLGRYAD